MNEYLNEWDDGRKEIVRKESNGFCFRTSIFWGNRAPIDPNKFESNEQDWIELKFVNPAVLKQEEDRPIISFLTIVRINSPALNATRLNCLRKLWRGRKGAATEFNWDDCYIITASTWISPLPWKCDLPLALEMWIHRVIRGEWRLCQTLSSPWTELIGSLNRLSFCSADS